MLIRSHEINDSKVSDSSMASLQIPCSIGSYINNLTCKCGKTFARTKKDSLASFISHALYKRDINLTGITFLLFFIGPSPLVNWSAFSLVYT